LEGVDDSNAVNVFAAFTDESMPISLELFMLGWVVLNAEEQGVVHQVEPF